MTELISHGLTCRGCGTPLVKKPGGGKPTYCPSCVTERARLAARDYQRRRRAGAGPVEPKPYVCQECNGEFTPPRSGGPRPERCPACRPLRVAEYQAAYDRARGHLQVGTSITVICECGTPFDWTVVVGRRAWKCQRCLDAAYADKMRRDSFMRKVNAPRPDLARVCQDCGRGFEQRAARCRRIVRCPRCAEDRATRLRRVYSMRYCAAISEAARFAYETLGRWTKCTGCGIQLANKRYGVREWCEQCLPQRQRDVGEAWRLRNPEAARLMSFRANMVRRARLAGVVREPYEREYILDRDKWVCQLCRKKIFRKYTGRHPLAPSIDHQIPLELGGPDTAANVAAAHFGCNSAKRSRFMPKGEQLALVG